MKFFSKILLPSLVATERSPSKCDANRYAREFRPLREPEDGRKRHICEQTAEIRTPAESFPFCTSNEKSRRGGTPKVIRHVGLLYNSPPERTRGGLYQVIRKVSGRILLHTASHALTVCCAFQEYKACSSRSRNAAIVILCRVIWSDRNRRREVRWNTLRPAEMSAGGGKLSGYRTRWLICLREQCEVLP